VSVIVSSNTLHMLFLPQGLLISSGNFFCQKECVEIVDVSIYNCINNSKLKSDWRNSLSKAEIATRVLGKCVLFIGPILFEQENKLHLGYFVSGYPICGDSLKVVKHLEKFPTFGGHLIFKNILAWTEEEYLWVGVSSHPLVKSRCKNPLPLRSHDLQMFRFMITFASCIVMGKAQGWGHSQNVEPKFATILS
jgi:hypothetical protein